jgi:ribonucleoside-diphosphate reductase alpha chain
VAATGVSEQRNSSSLRGVDLKEGLLSGSDLFQELEEAPSAPGPDERAAPVFSANAEVVLRKRYLRRSSDGKVLETPAEMLWRVATSIASAEESFGHDPDRWATCFYNLMARLEFMPNSPTLMNAGRELGQLSACFVLPVQDNMESIFEAVKNTALIHKSGGGTGFSFSSIRPKDDVVLSTRGISSGPISFMTVFDSATETIKQGGVRRGANMAVLAVEHPDILEFIDAKRDMQKLNNFNLSVAVTDRFMDSVERGIDYGLVNPRSGEPEKTLPASEVFNRIVDSAWASGEPGILFIDRMNEANPTPRIGRIEATNPCGEQPLLPYEACNLGSVNLAVMVTSRPDGSRSADWNRLESTVRNAVRFLDDVIEVNRYPLPQIADMVAGNRKIGLGVMGFADLLFELGIPYDSEEALRFAEQIMSFVENKARAASEELARERGPFPNFRGSVYDEQGLAPLRNATVTTIAPTGSISIIAGCSSGIEPVFALVYSRKNILDEGDELLEMVPSFASAATARGFNRPEVLREITAHGSCRGVEGVPPEMQRIFVTAHDVSPSYHIRMQAAFQKFTDNAVSKTVNLPESATREDVAEAYRLAFRLRCKGVTVYRDRSRDKQVLNIGKPEQAVVSAEPVVTSIGPRPRPEVTTGLTRRVSTGCGNLYITINEDEFGPVEIFSQMGKAGGCAASQAEAISRLVSLALRSHIPPEAIVRELKGISCHRLVWQSGDRIMSCADAIGKTLEWHIDSRLDGLPAASAEPRTLKAPDVLREDDLQNHAGACPNCGGPLKYESGCVACALNCGYSECG